MALLRVRRATRFAILAMSLPVLAACSNDSEPPDGHRTEVPAPAVNVEWTKFVDEFIEAYFVANPSFAVSQGRHEFDGQLPDWSAAGIQKEIARLEQVRERALTFQDSTLSPEERFQRDYVLSRIDGDLFWIREAR
ncbi:MAG: DUF885 domain-containing protein, partial [Steroidobacteraceae bacterium]